MITISATSKPFSNKNESGDFYQYIELEDYFFDLLAALGGLISRCPNQTSAKSFSLIL